MRAKTYLPVLRLGFSGGRKLIRPSSSLSKPEDTSNLWSKAILPGGFTADGLREWAVLNDFGATDNCGTSPTSQDMRRRKRQLVDEPYVDLFARRVSDECSQYLSQHPSPSDELGRAFFGSTNFMVERMILSSLNSLFSLYPEGTSTLPTVFGLNDQYLQWKVTMKAPLELICSYHIDRLNFRGCTMLAYDPALKKVYHGNCIDFAEQRIEQGMILKTSFEIHKKYAEFLLAGMVSTLERRSNEKK
jgi:hypothetical protein